MCILKGSGSFAVTVHDVLDTLAPLMEVCIEKLLYANTGQKAGHIAALIHNIHLPAP
jgi:hypothetical protein